GSAVVDVLMVYQMLKFGTVTREILLATVFGHLLGIVLLGMLAGGAGPLIATYQLSVSKNYELKYAILTGDGPWHRYLVDLMLVSPIIMLLAIGAVFNLRQAKKAEWGFSIFIATSYR